MLVNWWGVNSILTLKKLIEALIFGTAKINEEVVTEKITEVLGSKKMMTFKII